MSKPAEDSETQSKSHLLDKLYRICLADLEKKSDFEGRMASLARAVAFARTLEQLRALGTTSEELAAVQARAKADAEKASNPLKTTSGTKSSPAWSPSPYPGHGAKYGYSVQSWLAKEVNQLLHPGLFFCWFAKHFNAMKNGDDSNPIWIYLILDRAVEQGGVNNAKIKDIRTNLMRAADKELRAAGRSSEIPKVLAAIAAAPLTSMTPQLWRIDLSKIAGRYTSGHQYPDEFNIRDLKPNEFKVVVP